jgi:antitoxin component YwqK of YwqJK toxin-antitoxin module
MVKKMFGMCRSILFLLSVSILLASCQSDLEVVEKTDDQGYVERYTVRKEDGAKEGWYVKSAPNTIILEETQFVNDTVHGLSIQYYPNGDTLSVTTYEKGIRNGQQIVYYAGGGIEEVVTYTNGSKTGPFVEYWKDGKLKTEGTYFDGHENGDIKNYDQQGNHYRTLNCIDDVCITKWIDPAYDRQ